MEKLKPCINQATTMPYSFEEDLKAYSAAGFRYFELWLAKLERYLEGKTMSDVKKLINECRLKPIAACFHSGILLAEAEERKKSISEFVRKLKICKELGVKYLVVGEYHTESNPRFYETAIKSAQEIGDIAKEYGVYLALEFIKTSKFFGELNSAIRIVRGAKRRNVGILFDTFHFYCGVSKLEDISNLKKTELFFVHINDLNKQVPRESATDNDRVFLGDGSFPLRAMISRLKKIGYNGCISLELFNEKIYNLGIEEITRKSYRCLMRFS